MRLLYTSNRLLFNVVKSEAMMFLGTMFLISTIATLATVYTAIYQGKLADDTMVWALWVALAFWVLVLVIQLYLVGHLVYRPRARPNRRV